MNLLQLALQNAAAPQQIRFAATGNSSEVFLKGVISRDFGVGAAALRDAFVQASGAPITLYINSPGGDVFEAREMQGIIAGHPASVTAVIQGVAASAATIVSMAAAKVQMTKGSRFMIHNGRTLAFGDRHEMLDMHNLLATFDAELAAEYAAKTGGKVDAMVQMMDAETWFTADQAKEQGFVDEVIGNTQNASMKATWNLSAYANAPAIEDDVDSPSAAEIAAQAERVARLNRSRLAALLHPRT